MTTLDTTPEALAPGGSTAAGLGDRETVAPVSFVEHVFTSTDHKSSGTLLSVKALGAAAAVLVLAVLLGIERIGTTGTLLPDNTVPQLFSIYRVGLVFGVLAPLALGTSLIAVPLQVGARAVAFGRLAAFGVWAWIVGLVLIILAYATNGGIGGGNSDMVDLFYGALVIVCVGLTAVAVSVAATVLTTRAPGMTMRRVPLYSWAALVSSLGAIITLPVVAAASVMVFVDHRFSQTAFGAGSGPGTVLDFALRQPFTVVFAIPTVGLLAELAPVAFRRRQDGMQRQISMLGLGLMIFAAFGAVARYTPLWRWLETSGGNRFDDTVLVGVFVLVPLLGAVIVLGTSALVGRGAAPQVNAPFVFALLGTLLVLAGLIATDAGAVVDWHLLGTVFIEGSVLLVVFGCVLGGIGALAFWAPKVTGRTVGDRELLGLAGLGAIAAALAVGPLLIAGFLDQPADAGEFEADGPLTLLNLLNTVGQALMLLVVVGAVALFLRAWRSDEVVADDPWGGQTLEWGTTSPAPADNYLEPQTVMSAQPMVDRRATPQNGGDAS